MELSSENPVDERTHEKATAAEPWTGGRVPQGGQVTALGDHLDHDAPILRATISGLVLAHRLLFAVADHVDLVERHLVRLVEVALHVLGAIEAELDS